MMDADTIRPIVAKPQPINQPIAATPQQQFTSNSQPQVLRPSAAPGVNVHPNISGVRPPPPHVTTSGHPQANQPINNRPPPPQQLRRIDSRPTIPPTQLSQGQPINLQQRPLIPQQQQQQQPSQYPQGLRPTGQPQPIRQTIAQNPNYNSNLNTGQAPAVRGPPPGQGAQQNRPLFNPQQQAQQKPIQHQQPIQHQPQIDQQSHQQSLPHQQSLQSSAPPQQFQQGPQTRPQFIRPQAPQNAQLGQAPVRAPFIAPQQRLSQPPARSPQPPQPYPKVLSNQNSLDRIGVPQDLIRNTQMASDVISTPKSADTSVNRIPSSHDDDDDVVIGRVTTPAFSPIPPPKPTDTIAQIETNTSKNPSPKIFSTTPENLLSKSPSPQPPEYQQQPPYSNPIERSDSKRSIPSRPPSASDKTKTPSPEPNMITTTTPKPSVTFVDSNPIASHVAMENNKNSAITGKSPSPSALNTVREPTPRKSPIPDLQQYDRVSSSSPEPSVINFKPGPMSAEILKPRSPIPPVPQTTSPISLNTIINPDRLVTKSPEDMKRNSSPLPEKTSTSPQTPNVVTERPTNFTNGSILKGDGQKQKPPSAVRVKLKGDNDSGVDESTQGNERNGPGSPGSPLKSPSKIPGLSRPPSATPSNKSRSTSKPRTVKTPETPTEPIIKKVPMNKIQVGGAPSPNLKAVKSKIGSLENATHKPGGGHVKIETKKIDIKAAPRIDAKNDVYAPKGGDKKITQTKLQWSAKSKIGSLENAHHKPGGGDKKIESLKIDYKDKAKPKVGSKDYMKHVPGGGDVKIQTHKLDIKAQSKIGSLDNVKYKPGGGDKKIFDDKEYLKNIDHPITPTSPSQSPDPHGASTGADENLNQQS